MWRPFVKGPVVQTEPEDRSLEGRTLIMSGGSRGIGEAIAIQAARRGANIALIAKTTEPHPKLPGTIYTAAAAIESAGGKALPLVGDIRDDESVADAVARTVEQFGGIDIVVNNASALDLTPTADISMKKYDLMQDINARGAFLLTKTAIPHLRRSANPHVLTLSPPLNLEPKWFADIGTAYTISKFSMSLVTIGLAAELAGDGIAVNSLWPRTTINTAAVRNILSEELVARSRTPDIMADAAISIITKPSDLVTGQCFIDDEVLAGDGVTDFSGYRVVPGDVELELDFWMEWA
ncbi:MULTISPECIES: SDR family oxidoreductase [Gordonia]|uniref:SDR family oxidoreductase n=1 Tax=Gordonia TaxID=2053 RepID=UPI000683E9BF|nr:MULTISPECIES: NAD(P)-dependent oxidoreductase [Gordonia]MCR8899483.1 NAD(P)-dependent oxidoreductase [Gordonia sp. GONU]MCZ4651644.1 NAD(P)-dependent oxidoreductase [Gordonia amicalis]MDJ0455102.1 NAD(P)-dependent oxidoreductase [Gordonia amicalis]MDV7078519.1 NAD(P)-dependent oxidoreductase [Gordonia amicalis]UKO92009.1 NAD(P)-dependent oxidoreductase [Gordonia amicalis]